MPEPSDDENLDVTGSNPSKVISHDESSNSHSGEDITVTHFCSRVKWTTEVTNLFRWSHCHYHI